MFNYTSPCVFIRGSWRTVKLVNGDSTNAPSLLELRLKTWLCLLRVSQRQWYVQLQFVLFAEHCQTSRWSFYFQNEYILLNQSCDIRIWPGHCRGRWLGWWTKPLLISQDGKKVNSAVSSVWDNLKRHLVSCYSTYWNWVERPVASVTYIPSFNRFPRRQQGPQVKAFLSYAVKFARLYDASPRKPSCIQIVCCANFHWRSRKHSAPCWTGRLEDESSFSRHTCRMYVQLAQRAIFESDQGTPTSL